MSCISFVKFIVQCFIILIICKCNSFLIWILDCCITQYHWFSSLFNHLAELINYCVFSLDSSGFSTYKILSSKNKNVFVFNFVFIELVGTSSKMLTRSDIVFLILGGKHCLSLTPCSVVLTVVFCVDVLYQDEEVPFCSLWLSFYPEWV